jgi:hypothetical protein
LCGFVIHKWYIDPLSPVSLGKKEKLKFYPFIIHKWYLHRDIHVSLGKKKKITVSLVLIIFYIIF